MDLYERLSRMMMRRKYARVDEDRVDRSSSSMLMKSKTMKVPGRSDLSRRDSKLERTSSAVVAVSEAAPVPVPVVVVALAKPKRRHTTLRSSTNEAIDGAWFNNALRRSVAEGRLNLSTVL